MVKRPGCLFALQLALVSSSAKAQSSQAIGAALRRDIEMLWACQNADRYAHYKGMPAPKGEFETTASHQARVAAHRSHAEGERKANLLAVTRHTYMWEQRVRLTPYDADAARYTPVVLPDPPFRLSVPASSRLGSPDIAGTIRPRGGGMVRNSPHGGSLTTTLCGNPAFPIGCHAVKDLAPPPEIAQRWRSAGATLRVAYTLRPCAGADSGTVWHRSFTAIVCVDRVRLFFDSGAQPEEIFDWESGASP